MTRLESCAMCLRRTHLLGLLAGRIERAGRGRAALGGLLALGDDDLVAALGARADRAVHMARASFDAVRASEAIEAAQLSAVCRHGSWYPAALLDLDDAPAVLHVAGDPALLGALCRTDPVVPAVAIVGARRSTPYGLDVAGLLGRGLAAAGVTVVSGMALGIDSAAHVGALDADGPTIAVLAGGADRPYPASKVALHRRIVARGCVVSEMPPGTGIMRWAFPARNRIIAGLAAATVVVEAQERSGSLITAEIAADLGRPVGAVPGPVTGPRSLGTNALLHDGAAVVRDARDALDLTAIDVQAPLRPRPARPPVRPRPAPAPSPAPDDPELRRALAAVDDGADSPDRLAQALGGDVARASVALTRLELAGLLRRELDGRYARRAGT